jgi:hypothetical protein
VSIADFTPLSTFQSINISHFASRFYLYRGSLLHDFPIAILVGTVADNLPRQSQLFHLACNTAL